MSPLRFYNAMSKKKEDFAVPHSRITHIYNCGPTVYTRQHLGNMRRFLFSDFLRRTLEYYGYRVKDITNITDVGHLTEDDIDEGEDKIERAATAAKLTPSALAETQISFFHNDLRSLNILPAHHYPRASAHVAQMLDMISLLLASGHAYKVSTGIYFDVASFPDYGKLSGNKLEALKAGRRVAVRSEKKHPADFALWKFDTHRLQQWDSPWGRGYPGWHIECSAMSLAYLGDRIDIHTGGEDNRFPHHENEIAQFEAALSKPFARIWMHNAHLRFEGGKLKKREGVQLTLDTVHERGYSPLAFRLLVFGSHYRSKLDFSWEALTQAQTTLDYFSSLLRRLSDASPSSPDAATIVSFKEALADDLATPEALAVISQYVRSAHSKLDSGTSDQAAILATLLDMDKVLGIFARLREALTLEIIPDSIKTLSQEREHARTRGDYARADELRRTIEENGFIIEDTPNEPRIRRLSTSTSR
jgi:cysteinyl-tRNA synthetase